MRQQHRKSVQLVLQSLLVGACVGILTVPKVQAQSTELTRAEVYRLQNFVELLLSNQASRKARLQDILAPRDALRTGSRSRAELLFNEGSVARIGSNATFRFVPGTKRYQLPDGSERAETIFQLRQGVALIVSPPGGQGGGIDTTIETPGGTVELLAAATEQLDSAAAAIVIYDPGASQMTVLALTDGIRVFDGLGQGSILLQGGQKIDVIDGQLGAIQNFDLRLFYNTAELASGLGPNQAELLNQDPAQVRKTLRAARRGTLAAITIQDEWLQGLCTLYARTAENCITTGADDPLTDFTEWREDVFEREGQEPMPDPDPVPPPDPDPDPDPNPNNQPGTVP